jgi:hypothetical protein
VPLGRNHARPRYTVRVRPTATRGTACVRGTQHKRATVTLHSGGAARRRRCSVSRRRHGADAWETARNDGSPARGWRRGVTATAERRGGRGGTAMVRAARLRTAAVGTWLGRDGGATGEACGGGREAFGRAASDARCDRGDGGAREADCWDVWRAVPTAALSRGRRRGTARGV